jgi:hypothetical protein
LELLVFSSKVIKTKLQKGNGDFFCLGSENLQELMEFNVGDIIGVGNHAAMG